MPDSPLRVRQSGRVGSAWLVAAGITLGVLAGVITPGAAAAYANPSHGSAGAPVGHGNGNPHNQTSSVQTQSSKSSMIQAASTSATSSSQPPGHSKTSGGVHAASLEPDSGSSTISIPGNCQSPQCQAVEATLAQLAGSPPGPSAQTPTSSTTVPSAGRNTIVPGRVLASSRPRPAVRGANPTTNKPSLAPPAPTNTGPSVLDEPMQLATGGWQGISLQAATSLRIPILFGAAVLLFVLLQALVDRRDPKMTRAPERGEDDSMGFS
ncbi:MAG TPA: hypothetical protein VFZ97_01145 [Acidimicrobiales bacterium]